MRLATIFGLLLTLLGLTPRAQADITVLLEEPYSLDGTVAGTGHTALYLSRVCAASPTVLRRCQPGETGVVISRYHRIAGKDWIAIPLIPYLYAVERPEDIPLLANAKLEASLREQYRRKHLQGLVPDTPDEDDSSRDWYELVGSAYDRTLYGFQIETTPEKDDAFIAKYNANPNVKSYKLVTSNCADFVREAVNFYYPHAVGRSFLSDLAVTTPKHAAKSFVKYTKKHPELISISFIIPQVPGTIKRSTPIHGLVDGVFKAKKYVLPLLALHPIIAGGVAVDYFVSGRFDPAKNALVLDPSQGTLNSPLSGEDRKSFEKGLNELLDAEVEPESTPNTPAWKQFQAKADLVADDPGGPVLEALEGENLYAVGLSRSNILSASTPSELTRQLLVTRLRDELKTRSTSRKVSDAGIREDWQLLQTIISIQRSSGSNVNSPVKFNSAPSANPEPAVVPAVAATGGAN
jgi:hypothetical protein